MKVQFRQRAGNGHDAYLCEGEYADLATVRTMCELLARSVGGFIVAINSDKPHAAPVASFTGAVPGELILMRSCERCKLPAAALHVYQRETGGEDFLCLTCLLGLDAPGDPTIAGFPIGGNPSSD